MPLSLFLTGVTGYIGGDLFVHLLQHHRDEFEITVMVRSESSAKLIAEQYKGTVKTVVGSYEQTDILKNAAKEYDVSLLCFLFSFLKGF